jgi:enamine deaminase RidA (YjgF/YER057c/UK114 family)
MKTNYLRSILLMSLGVVVGFFLARGMEQSGADEGRSNAVAAQGKTPSAEERVRQLKLELPKVKKSTNTLVGAVRVGDLLFVSGHGPAKPDGGAWTGRLGQDLDVKQGAAAARSVGLQILSVVKEEIGSLDKVVRVVKTLGMVNATADFKDHPKVINGFSDLMVEVFGEEAGKGARSAVGMSGLPGGIPVEIEVIFQVKRPGNSSVR